MIGKLIGFALGFGFRGFLGGVVGAIIGHLLFDRRAQAPAPSAEQLQQVQRTFFSAVFSLLGYLAKSDGRVSETEIRLTEILMSKMGLTTEHRREAIGLFKNGSASGFNANEVLDEFKRVCASSPNLTQMLLVYLINLALADGHINEQEQLILRQVADRLGFSRFAFEQLLRMIAAQNSFGQGQQKRSQESELDSAYIALGVEKTASDGELKKAYRKLMSEYHPDKLIGQGMPDDMIKSATERSQEIQAAYELIKKMRA
jgi:DnaJ like chaperone protein